MKTEGNLGNSIEVYALDSEIFASDTYFSTKVTNQGHTCSQIFVGVDSDIWVTYPLKRESSNGEALQDYIYPSRFDEGSQW
jgi:hypothetical protein